MTVDNVRFASKAEAARYTELKILYRSGKISGLILHPKFEIRWPTNNQKICSVILDFQYTDGNGDIVYEDVKSGPTNTAVSKLKRKLCETAYGIDITLLFVGKLKRY